MALVLEANRLELGCVQFEPLGTRLGNCGLRWRRCILGRAFFRRSLLFLGLLVGRLRRGLWFATDLQGELRRRSGFSWRRLRWRRSGLLAELELEGRTLGLRHDATRSSSGVRSQVLGGSA